MNKIVILDGNGFVHRYYHGYKPQLDKNGEDQRILYGFMKFISEIDYHIQDIDYLYLIFDPSDGNLYRKSIFPAYKENRPPTEPDLSRQKDIAKKVLVEDLGIPNILINGYEADDIIGSLVKELSVDPENEIIVMSGDKDLLQLVKNNVKIIRPKKIDGKKTYETITEFGVEKYFGVKPNQIADLLALCGDTVDNLPGIDDMGYKKGANLLNQFISIEHMLSLPEVLPEEYREKIVENKDTLLLVKKLTTIHCDLDVKDKIQHAIHKSIEIQNSKNYNKKIIELSKYCNWPIEFIRLFLD